VAKGVGEERSQSLVTRTSISENRVQHSALNGRVGFVGRRLSVENRPGTGWGS